MALGIKYTAFYDNPQGEQFIVVLAQEGYTGQPIEIRCTAVITYDRIKDPFTTIRPSSVSCSLEASEAQTFEDLFTDAERQYALGIVRNGTELWEGWVSPESWLADWVNDKWVVEVTADDGLKYLKNLSYVDDAAQPYVGFESVIKIIANCLKRTGFPLKIAYALNNNDEDPLRADVTLGDEDFLNCTLNQDVFIEDKKDSINDCYTVLENVLGCGLFAIFQDRGRWNIVNLAELAFPTYQSSITWRVYDENGENPVNETGNIARTIGSQIDGAPIFWVNENQRYEGRATLSGAQAEFTFREPAGLLVNDDFTNDGTSITGWTFLQGGAFAGLIAPSELRTNRVDNNFQTLLVKCDTQPTVLQAVQLSIDIKYRVEAGQELNGPIFKVKLTGSTTNYWLNEGGQWVTVDSSVFVDTQGIGLERNYIIQSTEATPEAGTLEIWLLQPTWNSLVAPAGAVIYDKFTLGFVYPGDSTGILHTAERISAPSSVVSQNVEYLVADEPDDLPYKGTLYLSDKTTRVTGGFKSAFNPASGEKILEINTKTKLELQSTTTKFFSGDIYQFIEYFSRVIITDLAGIYMVASYSYNTREGIISLDLQQIQSTLIASDIEHRRKIIYAKVISPTIKG